nr:reverse transcriptase domain-containing protein [Tanacetum cinerariifolium]
MFQPCERVARQKITQSFFPNTKIFFPPLDEEEGTEGSMIIEAEIGGHCIHRMYVDDRSASEILANITTGKDWRRRTLLFGLDEFHGGKVIIYIQRNYWKARSQETTRSSVNSSQNAEAPSRKRSNYPKKQQVSPARPAHMTNVPRHIAEHRLNVQEGCSLVTQKKRGQAADRNHAIQEKVRKLVKAGIMKEVHYHDWLSNLVMVKKHDDSWRMCVDFKDLNKACSKDGYPLPEIVWKVKSLCGFLFKCFLVAYKGYHQIQMEKEDEEKIAFITSQGIFCYTNMPFGLRNARATYQRLVDKAFHKQIGRNLEVYVDELVIKTRTEDEIVRDTVETFKTLRKINMKPRVSVKGKVEELPEPWILFTNGSSCTDGSRAGLILTNPEGIEFTYALRFSQVNGMYVAKEVDMIRYLEKEKSISEVEIIAVVEEEEDTWMTPIFEYLTEETLPMDVKKARAVRRKSQRFAIINGTLYKKSVLGLWLWCVGPLQANYVLREIHEGSCIMHASTQSVMAKALKIGYYWPTMYKDARSLIRACQDYNNPQIFININIYL